MRKMMRIFAMAVAVTMVFTFAGCELAGFDLNDWIPGGNQNEGGAVMAPEVSGSDFYAPEVEATEPLMEAPEEASVTDLMAALTVLNTSFTGTYGVVADMSRPHSRIYASEEACIAGETPLEIRGGTCSADISHDPALMVLYPVTSVDSLDAWQEYLSNYFSPAMVEKWAAEQDCLAEYFGVLYLTRGGQGYGAWTLRLDQVQIVSQGDGSCAVTVDCYAFDEYESTYQVEFLWNGSRWIIDDYYTV